MTTRSCMMLHHERMTSDEHSHLDSESQSMLRELGATSVSRCRVLKAARAHPWPWLGAPGRIRPLPCEAGPQVLQVPSPPLPHRRRLPPRALPGRRLHQAGAPVDTNNPGVYVPHLPVDCWHSIDGANHDPHQPRHHYAHLEPALGRWLNGPCVASILPRPDAHGVGGAGAGGFAARSCMRLHEEKH
jgi:hypothetical protein